MSNSIERLWNYTVILNIIILLSSFNLFSQDVEPRRWNSLPLGTNAIGGGYAFTFGDTNFDPILEAEDVTIEFNSFIVSYVRPFKLANKLARIDVLLPYTIAKWEGLLSGNPAKVKRNGLSDPRIRLSMNLIGSPPSGPKELQEYLVAHPINTTVGVSVAIRLPIGQYYDDKLLNLGDNQFKIVPQIGIVHNRGKWSYEFTASGIFYTKNNDFLNVNEKKQDPTLGLQAHIIRKFKPGYWASISSAYGLTGQSIINSEPISDERIDIIGSLAFGFPVAKMQGMKIAYFLSDTMTDIGANTNTFALGWSILFK